MDAAGKVGMKGGGFLRLPVPLSLFLLTFAAPERLCASHRRLQITN